VWLIKGFTVKAWAIGTGDSTLSEVLQSFYL